MSLLAVEGVSSGYGEMEILHEVSIRVERGEFVTLIGPNGAGKSTLLKTVFGLLEPRRGRIRLDGEDITGRPPAALVRRSPPTRTTISCTARRTRRRTWRGCTRSRRSGSTSRPAGS